jgi:hypothetical protein
MRPQASTVGLTGRNDVALGCAVATRQTDRSPSRHRARAGAIAPRLNRDNTREPRGLLPSTGASGRAGGTATPAPGSTRRAIAVPGERGHGSEGQ